ncbi:hypothetical protein GCM10011414_16300 [Croceivirga lutea]|nr:hypothetical protein GCM10011414_16300 [Croceivirga lutea]
MKNLKLIFGVIFCIALLNTSCNSTAKKEEQNNESNSTNVTATTSTVDSEVTNEKELAYSCPMDCEDGKTYAKEGKCPVCKMDLALHDSKTDDEHKEKLCQCKEGECKCVEGECKCGTPGYDHFGNKI